MPLLGLVGAAGPRAASEELQAILKQKFLDAMEIRKQELEEEKAAQDQQRFTAGGPLRDATLEHLRAQTYALQNPRVTPTRVNLDPQDISIIGPDGLPITIKGSYNQETGKWTNQAGDIVHARPLPKTNENTVSFQQAKVRVLDANGKPVLGPDGKPKDIPANYDNKLGKYKDMAGNIIEYPGLIEDEPKPDALNAFQEINTRIRLQEKWDQDVAPFRTVQGASGQMRAALAALQSGDQTMRGPASESIRILFEKILDPTSVVREGEYKRQLQNHSWRARIQGMKQAIIDGGGNIADKDLAGYVAIANEFVRQSALALNDRRERMIANAESVHMNPLHILGRDFTDDWSETSALPGGGGGGGGPAVPAAPPPKRTGLGAIFAPTAPAATTPAASPVTPPAAPQVAPPAAAGDLKIGDPVGQGGAPTAPVTGPGSAGRGATPSTIVDLGGAGMVVIRTPGGMMKAVPANSDQARGATPAPPPAPGMTRMRTPSGQVKDVPAKMPDPNNPGQMIDAVKFYQDALQAVVIARGR